MAGLTAANYENLAINQALIMQALVQTQAQRDYYRECAVETLPTPEPEEEGWKWPWQN